MKRDGESLADRIVGLLERGTVPWHRPWRGPDSHPRNLISKRPYRGLTAFILSAVGYESPFWLTSEEANVRGGSVRKGERGWPCVKLALDKTEEGNLEEPPQGRVLKDCPVFNVEQCKGLEYPHSRHSTPCDIRKRCEAVVQGMPLPPKIEKACSRAMYNPGYDRVTMRDIGVFDDFQEYYRTFFHELAHSTGHPKRLGRFNPDLLYYPGAKGYDEEELVADMGATFLCGYAGISPKATRDPQFYGSLWIAKLQDPLIGGSQKNILLLVRTADQAQKASDFILDCYGGY